MYVCNMLEDFALAFHQQGAPRPTYTATDAPSSRFPSSLCRHPWCGAIRSMIIRGSVP